MSPEKTSDSAPGIAENAAFAIMMAIAAYLGRENPRFVYPEILWVFLALLAFNLANFTALSRRLKPRRRAQVAAVVNTALISLVVLFSGGRESYFWVMYLLPVFSAALAFERNGVLACVGGIVVLLALFDAPSLRGGVWIDFFQMSVKMLTLLAAAGMSWRVASAERRARSLLEREHERALQERLEMREKLQHIDRLATLGTLSAGLAHEINGPLTSILGYSQTGLEFASADAEQAKMFAGIESAARRCRDIVKNTLAFARSRAGEREPADLNALLRQCVALKRHDWLGGTVSIEESYDPDLPRASVKGAEIQQIVFNLLTNAEQAIRSVPGAGGAIRVATSSADGRVRIRIEDDGPGIPESSLKKIWEPFYTTKPVGQGTGLGLAISRTIAQNHGGTLDVETSPGRTAFVLALPVETAKIG